MAQAAMMINRERVRGMLRGRRWRCHSRLQAAGLYMMEEGVRTMIYQNQLSADVNVRTWKFDAVRLNELSRRGAMFDARETDLGRFKAAGGKLLLWHGAADGAAGMYAIPHYYQQLQKAMGGRTKTRDFARFFLIPGVDHCVGGYVPYEEDLLGAMVAWVERGVAPDKVISTAVLKDGTVRRRPVYPYPTQARYTGSGDINAAASFGLKEPRGPINDTYNWLGDVSPRSRR
jgi:hypothetical protein